MGQALYSIVAPYITVVMEVGIEEPIVEPYQTAHLYLKVTYCNDINLRYNIKKELLCHM